MCNSVYIALLQLARNILLPIYLCILQRLSKKTKPILGVSYKLDLLEAHHGLPNLALWQRKTLRLRFYVIFISFHVEDVNCSLPG